jgi:hypothetical protein
MALATTVLPDGTISAFEVARAALAAPGAWRPALADALLDPGVLAALICTGPWLRFASGALPASDET